MPPPPNARNDGGLYFEAKVTWSPEAHMSKNQNDQRNPKLKGNVMYQRLFRQLQHSNTFDVTWHAVDPGEALLIS